jgi:DNA helicase-2/ATP-dependent DNA helicase PcrA
MIDTLNPHQREAVFHCAGPLMIVAGAGSGKTMVLTQKIAYLVRELGVYPDHILAITFTNKAAKEMLHRVGPLIEDSRKPFVGTFHAFCGAVLRRDMGYLGRATSYVILDYADQLKLIKKIAAKFNLDENKYPPAALLSGIDRQKNALVDPEKYPTQGSYDAILGQVYAMYQKELSAQNAVDFNDMIGLTVQLFQDFPEVLERYQDQYPYIMVDEYQDTNDAQHALIHMLAGKYNNLTVVGDFDQTIYSWRGATVRHMLSFEKTYPGATVVKLEQNYRSSGHILKAANGLIQQNTQRREKNLWTEAGDGEHVLYYLAADEREEARYIADTMQAQMKKGTPAQEMAVLYRTNAQSRVLEETFAQRGIPYRLVGGLKFFARAEIKDMLAYLRLVHNPQDYIALSRAISAPSRGVGAASVDKFTEWAQRMALPVHALLDRTDSPLGARFMAGIVQFYRFIFHLKEILDSDVVVSSVTETPSSSEPRRVWGPVSTEPKAPRVDFPLARVIRTILDSGYATYLQKDEKGADKLENIYELISMTEEQQSLDAFLETAALATDWDTQEEQPNAVTFTTVHLAKGLEYDLVVVAGMEEKIFPHYRSLTLEEIEEERRLCYVAITRGRKWVYLTAAKQRLIFGDYSRNAPSRFLDDIPPEHMSRSEASKRSIFGSTTTSQPRIFPPVMKANSAMPVQIYVQGESVRHSQWGVGYVKRIEGEGEKAILHVSFGGHMKTLIAKYAPLEKIA